MNARSTALAEQSTESAFGLGIEFAVLVLTTAVLVAIAARTAPRVT